MKFKGFYTAMTAASLLAVPTLAAAAPIATPLTQPATEKVDGDNAAVGGSSLIIALAAVAAIGAGIYVAVDKNDTKPTSP
ncbi:hypothetical protein [Sphingomonas sp. Leaf357]|uniref:hypothetical protein n=1 Tax=Sphingomonas sp. Leaf357 TaxID=1736350 RepID=UPI0012E2C3A0|nr:hypothetical protein [Sphingomonas sp. Leaf357]